MPAPAVYDHRQRALWVVPLVLGIGASLIAFAAFVPGAPGWTPWFSGALIALLLVVAWLFSSLRVTVGAGRVRAAFGPGWPRWERALADVAGVAAVRNRWWYGWGIRLTPGGWMFNVAGLDAVELTLASGRRFRIGTDEPAALVAALEAALDAARSPRP